MRVEYPEPPKYVETWWVIPDNPVDQLTTCDGEELACVWGVLYGMRADRLARKYEFDDTNLIVTAISTPQLAFVVQEPSMRVFMHVLRANGIHGQYRKAGLREPFRF